MTKLGKLIVLTAIFFTSIAVAAPENKAKVSDKYFSMHNPFVTNYGGPGRLKYFTVRVSLQVPNAEARTILDYHQPLVRHTLTMYFNEQTDATIKSASGQEKLRQGALKAVQQAFIDEVKNPVVEDILFSNLNYQE